MIFEPAIAEIAVLRSQSRLPLRISLHPSFFRCLSQEVLLSREKAVVGGVRKMSAHCDWLEFQDSAAIDVSRLLFPSV